MVPNDLKGKPVIVVWDDASQDQQDYDEHEYEHTITYTVGILGKKSKAGVIIYTDYVPALRTYGGRYCIPKGMIKEIIPLA